MILHYSATLCVGLYVMLISLLRICQHLESWNYVCDNYFLEPFILFI